MKNVKNIIKYLKKDGFSLVELSIGLIIAGIFVAGISAGTSLMEQATLNSVITDLQTYTSAYNSFTKAYGQAPGDFSNASAYWPTGCVTSIIPTDCDGNGDGILGSPTEQLLVWKHLSLAGFISSGIVPVPIPVTSIDILEVGKNNPASKMVGAGYQVGDGILGFGAGVQLIGLAKPFQGSQTLDTPALTSGQGFNIDQKIDDGSLNSNGISMGAVTGMVRSFTLPFISTTLCTDNVTGNTYLNLNSTIASCGVTLKASW